MASRLNKKQLYEEYKILQKENIKIQLFLNNSEDVKNKQKICIDCWEKENKELIKENKKLKEENKELLINIKLKDEIIGLLESGDIL